ncbi:DUF3667 domain-containing protein [Arcicella lustrica]|uniref:DUF3667 domain-containing protein n=1 Tax=Arcicella lustrica TaxID=2984196 RepID=A0ABU5SQM5_9BACT|nr:DUF3667 domain-containing protein [Arcicella sp. DC25W]MEA5429580.1 DUF3667 domain-containing protein [Arcicella sp. DC25W]
MSEHKKRRKVEICHNCHTILKPEDNFCPNCGQENHDLKVPVSHLIFEVVEGFTHLDTKLYNTLRAIFLYPGKITKDFLEGRRGRYVPPIRLYFLASFLFFLLLGFMIDTAIEKGQNGFFDGVVDGVSESKSKAEKENQKRLKNAKKALKEIKSSSDTNGLYKAEYELNDVKSDIKDLENLDEQTKDLQKKTNSWIDFVNIDADEILDEMNIQNDDTLRTLIEKLPEHQQRQRLIAIQKQIVLDTVNTVELSDVSNEMSEYFTETIGTKSQLKYVLRLHSLKNNALLKVQYFQDTIITIKGSDGSVENKAYKQRILKMSDTELDSLITHRKKTGRASTNFMGFLALERGFLRNVTHYELAFEEDAETAIQEITHFGIGVFSLMMFILMPIVAILLKFLYSKRSHSFFTYPFRILRYLWDYFLYLIRFRKTRRYQYVPNILEGHTRYYYEHLIFSIHIHSVLFLMIVIFVGGGVFFGYWKEALSATMLGFIIYFIVALKVVYRQRLFKTIFKSFILFFLYIISFFTILSITGAIKFALS